MNVISHLAHLERLRPLVSHTDIPRDAQLSMTLIRQHYLDLAELVIERLPEGRSKRLALTQLEESLMRAIQALALQGTPEVEVLEK